MGAKRQQPDSAAFSSTSGAAVQSVVELITVRPCGLVFWSRHCFEIASELQLRLESQALAGAATVAALKARDGWVLVRGFVVDCNPARRPDGTVGFEVTLVFEPTITVPRKRARLGAPAPRGRHGAGLN
jgi:hypothetical protein